MFFLGAVTIFRSDDTLLEMIFFFYESWKGIQLVEIRSNFFRGRQISLLGTVFLEIKPATSYQISRSGINFLLLNGRSVGSLKWRHQNSWEGFDVFLKGLSRVSRFLEMTANIFFRSDSRIYRKNFQIHPSGVKLLLPTLDVEISKAASSFPKGYQVSRGRSRFSKGRQISPKGRQFFRTDLHLFLKWHQISRQLK